MNEYDPSINRGVLPKDWHRCLNCDTTIPERSANLDEAKGGWICADRSWCALYSRTAEQTRWNWGGA